MFEILEHALYGSLLIIDSMMRFQICYNISWRGFWMRAAGLQNAEYTSSLKYN